MAGPSSFSTFDGLSPSEVASLQSCVPEQGSRPRILYDDYQLLPVLTRPDGAQPPTFSLGSSLGTSSRGRGRALFRGRGPLPLVRRDWPQQPLALCPGQQSLLQRPPVLYPRQRPPSQRPPALPPRQQPLIRGPTVPARPAYWQESGSTFPVRREYIRRVFKYLSEMPGSQLPAPVEPERASFLSHPYYCPYHRTMAHPLEECLSFEGWLRRAITDGSVVLPSVYLTLPLASSESCADNSFDISADSRDS